MALLQKSTSMFAHRLPKVLGPGTHAIADYSVAALFFGAGILFFRRHKSAALSALFCGTGVLLNSLFTNYPGGAVGGMSFETHGKIDYGLAGLTASIPEMMGFEDDAQARFFEATAIAETLAAGFTDYKSEPEHGFRELKHRQVA